MDPIVTHKNLTEDELTRLGHILAALLKPGDFIGLSGPLGAGKSVFARAVVRTAMGDETLDVPSPTYTLVHPYRPPAPTPELLHIDLYRVETEAELRELGLDDALASVVLVEWPERLGGTFPGDGLTVKISPGSAENLRTVTFLGDKAWKARLKNQVLLRA